MDKSDMKQFDDHIRQLFYKRSVKNLADEIKKQEESLQRDKDRIAADEFILVCRRQNLRSWIEEYEQLYPPSKTTG
jgi:hypothetical protein